MTPSKPAGEMPDVLYAQRSERFGYIASPHKTEPDDVRYIRADKPDAAAAREALDDLDDLAMWVRELREIVPRDGIEMCGVSARLMNIEAWCRNEIPTIKRILQREAGL